MQDSDFELLGILSFSEGRTLEELRKLLELAGKDLPDDQLALWIEKDLLALENECVLFTSKERQLAIHWFAFAKAAEMDALEGLTFDETQQLKLLLGHVTRHSRGIAGAMAQGKYLAGQQHLAAGEFSQAS